MEAILEISKLRAPQGIDYPSFSVEKGMVTFLCGESGCGKSTLLKLFNATLNPASGQILYQNKPLESWDSILLRRQVLLVSQHVFLFDGSIAWNFQEFYRYLELTPLPREQMEHFLHLCCLEADLSAKCQQMSGGERQRVYLAICLSLLPRVLLLDEPTSALDGETSNRLFTQLTHFAKEQGMTVLCVSHDRELAQTYADRIIVLGRGEGE